MNEPTSKTDNKKQTVRTTLAPVSFFLFVFASWVIGGFLPTWNLVPGIDFSVDGQVDPNRPGVFGDSFGWINSLFSALAFAGVLVTLWMQRKELTLQRDELAESRKQHERMANAQEESENRLFLNAYMNAVESLRQLSQWRMSADPATTQTATYPTVHGLVIQARVVESLHTLIKELEPEISKLHPAIGAVSEEGSWVWRLEEFLSIYQNLREVLESHLGRIDDAESFREANNIIRIQLNRLDEMKAYCGQHHHSGIDSIQSTAPNLDWKMGNVMGEQVEAREFRQRYFSDLQNTNREILSFVMSMCHE